MCKNKVIFSPLKQSSYILYIILFYNITQETLPPIRVTVTTNSSKSTAQKFSFLEVDTNKGVIFPTCHYAELTGFLMSLPQQAGFAFPRGGGGMISTSGITKCNVNVLYFRYHHVHVLHFRHYHVSVALSPILSFSRCSFFFASKWINDITQWAMASP